MVRAFTITCLLALFAACDDEAATPRDADATTADPQDTHEPDATATDAADTADADVIYVGFECNDDEACSTGLCYGRASLQGHFEPAECQAKCLGTFDYDHYCDTNADCCRGTCCIGCPGAQNGLCVLNP